MATQEYFIGKRVFIRGLRLSLDATIFDGRRRYFSSEEMGNLLRMKRKRNFDLTIVGIGQYQF